MNQAPKKYHHLITGQILYQLPNSEDEGANVVTLNAMILTDGPNITKEHLGWAQQSLGLQFHKIMNDPAIGIVNIVILNWANLGCMTEAEFEKVTRKSNVQTQEGDSPPALPN